MAAVYERALDDDGHMQQVVFPHFVLYKVLDIIHAERLDNIKAQFEETPTKREMYYNSMYIKEDDTLKAMSLVHRSWTFPVQKALGRILYIGKPVHEMDILLSPMKKSIFGSWTSVVSIQFFSPIKKEEKKEKAFCDDCETYLSPIELVHEYDTYECEDVHIKEEYRLWFDNLNRILAGFTHLDRLYIKRYGSVFSEWSGFLLEEIMRRNRYLEEITLCVKGSTVKFNIDSLVETSGILANLRTLEIQGALFSDVARKKAMSEPGFPRLSNLIIKCSMESLTRHLSVLNTLSIQVFVKSYKAQKLPEMTGKSGCVSEPILVWLSLSNLAYFLFYFPL